MSASTATTATTTSHAAVMSRREMVGRALMWLAVLGAAGAAGTALLAVLDAEGATKIVETAHVRPGRLHRPVLLLLLRPRYYRGVWELVIASKLAMTFTAVGYAAHGGIAGTGAIIGWDGGLAAVLIAAYICCRGWTAVPRLRGAEAPPRSAPR